MKIKKPLLIVFEGIDGSGKTTLSRMLQTFLAEKGHETLWLREPGDSSWGKRIRELAGREESIPIEEELNYFIEDRKLDVSQNITPALLQGKIVIVDRYYFSNACYQGARGLDMFEIIRLNRVFAPEPDITFIIDVDVDAALGRIRRTRDAEARLFERREFLQTVRANYLCLSRTGNPHIHLIDGHETLDVVFQRVLDRLETTL